MVKHITFKSHTLGSMSEKEYNKMLRDAKAGDAAASSQLAHLKAEFKAMQKSKRSAAAKAKRTPKGKSGYLTPFFCYMQKQKSKRPAGTSVAEWAKEKGAEWRAMSDAKKAKYAGKCKASSKAKAAKRGSKSLTLKAHILKELRASGLAAAAAKKAYAALSAAEKEGYKAGHKAALKAKRASAGKAKRAADKAAGKKPKARKSTYKRKTLSVEAGHLTTYQCFASKYMKKHPHPKNLTGEAAKAAKKEYMLGLAAAWAKVKGHKKEKKYVGCKPKSKVVKAKRVAKSVKLSSKLTLKRFAIELMMAEGMTKADAAKAWSKMTGSSPEFKRMVELHLDALAKLRSAKAKAKRAAAPKKAKKSKKTSSKKGKGKKKAKKD